MKRVLFLGLALASLSAANAQQAGIFKPFKVDVSFGTAIPQGSGSKGGVLFVVEPKYAVMDQLSVGLRLEAAVMARGFSSPDGESSSGSVSANASYLATGDYYFSNNTFRPFVGAGVGIFDVASASVDNNGYSESLGASTKFGGMLRAGFELSHFRMGIEYNFIGSTDMTQVNGSSSTTTVSSKNSYLGVKLGVCIGGGRAR